MRCPKCHQTEYYPPAPCRQCQFDGPAAVTEKLVQVNWLLEEIPAWEMVSRWSRDRVQQTYRDRQKALEIELGLRLPPFTKEEAQQAWPKLIRLETLRHRLGQWLEVELLDSTATQPVVDRTNRQIAEYLEQLEGHPRPQFPETDNDQLYLTCFLLEAAGQLQQTGGFASPEAEDQVVGPLLEKQTQLEIKLGLRPEPIPEPVEASPIEPIPDVEPVAPVSEPTPVVAEIPVKRVEPKPTAPQKPEKPRVPFRERLWQTLLSERTLQAMLFLGIFLLFAAAISFVAWGWRGFSAPVRVAIPTGFTAFFFGMGWYVRTKTPMHRSGLALSAIAALLIPIDFYTIYVNFNIPSSFWPYFWLITSVTCLTAYILATLAIHSRFFGYLVGVAAGSTVLALIEIGHQTAGLSLDWRSTGLSGLALGLIVLATILAPPASKTQSRHTFTVFAEPFRYLALLTISVIMLLTFGWRFTQRDTYDTLHYALTANWWLGGFLFAWGAIQYRSRGLGLLAAITLPVATYLAQAAMFYQTGISPAWHGFGWALLVPLYFMAGYKLLTYKNDPVLHSHGRTAIGWGIMLLVVAAFWPLIDIANGATISASHAMLAGAVVLAALLWQRPVYLYGASMLSFSATTFAMAEMDLIVAQLSVGWASLAIVHVLLAISVGTRFPIPVPNFAAPLVTAGYLIAATALLPTLFPYQGGYLLYALGNWLALTAWGARLAHIKQPGFVGKGIWRKPVFHWFTAIPLPIWVWILFDTLHLPNFTLPPALAVLAWLMLLLSYRLAKTSPHYRFPWSLTGGLLSIAAPIVAFATVPNGVTPGITLLIIGLLYFADAVTRRQSGELIPAGLVTAWGGISILNRLHPPTGVTAFGLAILVAIYVLTGLWTERKKSPVFTHQFLNPLYVTAHFLTLILLIQIYLPVVDHLILGLAWPDYTRLWAAASQFLLAVVYGLYAWNGYKERRAHLAAWLAAMSAAFVIFTYNFANGSTLAELALIPIGFILLERGLAGLVRRRVGSYRQQAFTRLTWRLFKRPVLMTGWIGSAVVIGASLIYGVLGSQMVQIWAMTALWLVVGLYAVSARLFRQARFAWLAALLSIAPWSLLADLNWFAPYPPQPTVFALSWVGLAWLLFLIGLTLTRRNLPVYAAAPNTVSRGLLIAVVAWSVIFLAPQNGMQALGPVAAGLLFFFDAGLNRQSWALSPAAIVSGWGLLTLLGWLNVLFETLGFALALLVAILILGGLWVEQKKSAVYTRRFLSPLYLTTHLLTASALGLSYVRLLDYTVSNLPWTDSMLLWCAAIQLVLGTVYGVYAWAVYKERWAHFAAWLLAFSGGFIAINFSTGSGSAAAKAALGAVAFVLAERWLHWLSQRRIAKNSQAKFVRLTWQLYRRPLLVTGWAISAGAIWLALIRNLLLLGGGYTREIWAAAALVLIVSLYAVSARLFRQVRFVWLAAPLSFIPWTILTHLGWFTPYRVTLWGYALSWIVLAWGLLLVSLAVNRRAGWLYALPLRVVAHVLVPFSLLWGIVDVETSRFTFGLAVAFYGLEAILRHRQVRESRQPLVNLWTTAAFYPALGLIPIWGVYLMAWLASAAPREQYGLMFLVFGPLGLAAGQWLYRLAPELKAGRWYSLPAYLPGYTSLVVGTALVAYRPDLLAGALIFDAMLMVVSAGLFKHTVWVYLAAMLVPLSLVTALYNADAPVERYGWWLIGLAWIYAAAAWTLQRVKLEAYKTAMLIVGFTMVALALPPSSLDQSGAFWGYGGAALLYAICALWLGHPLLLTLASGTALVPFGVILRNSALAPEYYGLALLPAAVVAMAVGWALDYHYGAYKDFPWGRPERWFVAVVERLLGWWALPLYGIGFGLAVASVFLVEFRAGLMAWCFFLMMPLFGWATYRFRLRGWLVALVLAGHLGAICYIAALGWWSAGNLAEAWLRFLPVTLIMALVTLIIEYRRGEVSPIQAKGVLNGWSHPLYIILIVDITIGQLISFNGTDSIAAVAVTLIHALLFAVLASFWESPKTVYVSIGLGIIGVMQWLATLDGPIQGLSMILALLSLIYGLAGYGITLLRAGLDDTRELRSWLRVWELPLQRSSLSLSLGTLAITALLGLEIVGWSTRALLGLPFRSLVDVTTVQMVVWVLGFLGLLYVAVSFTHRWLRLGYMAIGMLLSAWMLHVFYIQQWDDSRHLQWYAMPVGLYLLGIAYKEWQQENKNWARRLDYAATVLMMGSLFWQTLLYGGEFALLLGAEGLTAFFWGSARRLRRFLYAGMVGVILAAVGWILNSLSSINQWIVFGFVGLLLVAIAILVERKLEDIKSWRETLESWE